MDAVLGKLGRHFIVSAFVPALFFTLLSLVVFTPIIPPRVVIFFDEALSPLNEPGLLLLVLTIVIGFSLHSLNTAIYKVLEGYFLLYKIPAISNFQKKKVRKTYMKIRFLEKLYATLIDREVDQEIINQVKARLYRISATYQRNFPLDLNLIMPTRFGNAFRALERYPRLRYQIDAVLIWPRLIHVIPESYYTKLSESNDNLAFLVNCSLLSLMMAVLSGMAAIFQFLLLRYADAGKQPLYFIDAIPENTIKYQQNAYLYLVGVVIMMGLFVLFYRASIPLIVQYGDLVKSAFDLFRLSLIKDLGITMPEDYWSEIQVWENISWFVGHGLLNNDQFMMPFTYSNVLQEFEGSGFDIGDLDKHDLDIAGIEGLDEEA